MVRRHLAASCSPAEQRGPAAAAEGATAEALERRWPAGDPGPGAGSGVWVGPEDAGP